MKPRSPTFSWWRWCWPEPLNLRYPRFYEREIAAVESRLAALRSAPPEADNGEPSCTIVSRDAMLRISGKDPTAGLDTAIQWLSTSDESLQGKAISVLGSIGGPRARTALEEALPRLGRTGR